MLRKEISFCIAFAALLSLSSCPTPCPCLPEGEGEGIEGEIPVEGEGECPQDTSVIPDYSWEDIDVYEQPVIYHPEFLTSKIGIGFHADVSLEQRIDIISSVPCLDASSLDVSKSALPLWIRVDCPVLPCTPKSEILGAVAQLNHLPEVVYASPMFVVFGDDPLPVTNIVTIVFPIAISEQEIESIEEKYKLVLTYCTEYVHIETTVCRFISRMVFAPDTIFLVELINLEPSVLYAQVLWDAEISLDK